MSYRKLWIGLSVVVAPSFAVLGYYGWEIYRQAPPLPARVVTSDGQVVYTGEEIRTARTSGSRWAGRKSARCGDTGRMSPRTGPQIGFTAKRRGC